MPDDIIIEFINEHHVLTLATSDINKPWCCNCFYVFDKINMQFLFTSDEDTIHIKQVINNSEVAASIVLETTKIGLIRGLQITGTVCKVKKEEYLKHKLMYLKRFPYAILKGTPLWQLKTETLKMTDNRLGFGKKLYWNRENL